MATGIYTSVISLTVNGSNAPTKWHRLAEWILNKTCVLPTYRRPTSDTYRLKGRGWKKIIHAYGNQKKAGAAIFLSDKIA